MISFGKFFTRILGLSALTLLVLAGPARSDHHCSKCMTEKCMPIAARCEGLKSGSAEKQQCVEQLSACNASCRAQPGCG